MERKHLHLINIARALMFLGCLPSGSGVKASKQQLISSTVYHQRLSTTKPHMRLYLVKAGLQSHACKIFGCLVFYKVPKPKVTSSN